MERYAFPERHSRGVQAEALPSPFRVRRVRSGRRLARVAALFAAVAAVWLGLFVATGPVSEWAAYSLLGLERGSSLGAAIAFFVYDTPRIFLLIAGATFVLSMAQSSITRERAIGILNRHRRVANVLGASFGMVTPFCSCSAVPIFMGFTSAGVPFSASIAFLTAAPLVNEIAVVLLFGLFGWQIALLYLVSGLTLAVLAGVTLGRLGFERYVEAIPIEASCGPSRPPGRAAKALSLPPRVVSAARSTRNVIGRVWIYVLVGIAVGAAMHNNFGGHYVDSIVGAEHWWTVPAVVAAGIPLYSNAAIFPIAQELFHQGIGLGTVIAFMMAVVGLSVPELILLRRVIRLPLLGAFVGVVGAGIVAMGYLFNWLDAIVPQLR
jgi:uncharacterized protein